MRDDNDPFEVADRAKSDERIAEAPAGIRALFHEYPEQWVYDALTMAGINGDPIAISPSTMTEGIETATRLLEAQRRRDQEAMFALMKRPKN